MDIWPIKDLCYLFSEFFFHKKPTKKLAVNYLAEVHVENGNQVGDRRVNRLSYDLFSFRQNRPTNTFINTLSNFAIYSFQNT